MTTGKAAPFIFAACSSFNRISMAATTHIRMTLSITEADQHRLLDGLGVLEMFTNAYEPQDIQQTLWCMLKESVGSEAGGDWFPDDRMRALDMYEQLCQLVPYLSLITKCLMQMEKE